MTGRPGGTKEALHAMLEGFAGATPIPVARRPLDPIRPGEVRAQESLALSPTLVAAVVAFSRENRLEPVTILEGAWALVLARYGGAASAVFGRSPSPGREPLPLRVGCAHEIRVAAFLERLAALERSLAASEGVTQAEVRELCDLPGDEPLFQSVFVRDAEPADPTAPLVVRAELTRDPRLTIEYAEAAFDSATIERMLGHVVQLILGLIASPTSPLGKLSLLTDRERQQLLVEWNRTEMSFPRDLCLHQLFEMQAARTPDATAVTFEDTSLSYRELDARAARLAERLRGLGTKPSAPVAIWVERSLDMPVGILGILKAGGAYVPIDPEHPRERVEFMLADSGAAIVVTQKALTAGLPASYAGSVVCLDSPDEGPREACVVRAPTATDLAYVIYTSGSTGKPKGCPIRHRSVVNHMLTLAQAPGLTSQDRVLGLANLAFDWAAEDFFLPWCVGAELVLAPSAARKDGVKLRALLERSHATFLDTTPVTWRLLIAAGWRGDGRLKASNGGDTIPRELAVALLERCGSVWNLYGPTETAITCTRHRVEPGTGLVPIGRPIGNVKVYLLDDRREPVPIGVPGELYVGGVGVGAGYLKRPELTAETFLRDPFVDDPEARMFKTGDLAVQRPDGAFVHLGRADFQVKVRGFRIELGEIEAALLAHPGVREAVVAGEKQGASEKRLVAYVVPAAMAGPTAAELRLFLKQKLADYMIPQAFVTLEQLPLLNNMKIDRKGLARAMPRADAGRATIAPRDETEEAVARAWRDALHVPALDVLDDVFLDLGADSITAAEVAATLSSKLDREITPEALAEHRTVEDLAAWLRGITEFTVQSQLVTLSQGPAKPDLFLIHSAGADAFAYLPLVRSLDGTDTVHVFQDRFRYTDGEYYHSVEEMAKEYVQVVRRRQPVGPYRVGGWSLGGAVALEMASQLVAAGERVSGVLLFDTSFPWRFPYRKWLHLKSWLQGLRWRIARRHPRLARAIPGTRAKLATLRQRAAPERLNSLIQTLAFLGVDERPVFTDELFPGLFEPGALARLAGEEAWAKLQARVMGDASGQDLARALADRRRRARVLALEDFLEDDYVPRSAYPGEVTLFALRGSRETGQRWLRWLSGPLVVRELDLKGTKRLPDPHEAMMQAVNVGLFAEEFRRFVERTRVSTGQRAPRPRALAASEGTAP